MADHLPIDRLGMHDPEACRLLILRHHAALYRFLAHLTHDAREAEELTAEVFAAAWQALPTFDGRASLATWLHRIAYTRFVDAQRRSNRASAAIGRRAAREPTEPVVDPFEGLNLSDQSVRLRDALSAMPDADRALILLHYTQRLSYSEISAITHEPEGTVKWRMSKLLRTLRDRLMETTDVYVHTSRPAGVSAKA